MPALIFAIALVIPFATASSWGAMAIDAIFSESIFCEHWSWQGKRIEILLVIAMLANVVLIMAGLDARARV